MERNFDFDFSGYVTKNDIKCSDGRTILHGAFDKNDQTIVPLVWEHGHNDITNILGSVLLEKRDDGVYGYGQFNGETDQGLAGKSLVKHGNITDMSIFANSLSEENLQVQHGVIREVSLVINGANPGAKIDFIAHSEQGPVVEALIFQDLGEIELKHGTTKYDDEASLQHSDTDTDKSYDDIYDTLNEDQKELFAAVAGQIALEHTSTKNKEQEKEGDDVIIHTFRNGGNADNMKSHLFDKNGSIQDELNKGKTLSHSQINAIYKEATERGASSLKEIFLKHTAKYGIKDVEILFPDAKAMADKPDMITREMDWVPKIVGKTSKKPWSNLKSVHGDITDEEARAKGYITGDEKVEGIFKLLTRKTYPDTIYIKEKIDRDVLIDATTLDIIAFMKAQMKVLLNEEVGRCILIGDGRLAADPQKVDEECIRPVYKDAQLYTERILVATADKTVAIMEKIIRSKKKYKGSGSPAFITTSDFATDMLLVKDEMGRRLYKSLAEVAADLRCSEIIEIDLLEGAHFTTNIHTGSDAAYDLIGMMVNMKDYAVGSNKGGQVTTFSDFDIDFNQHKQLMETRFSGALMKPKSAIVFEKPRVAG